MAAINRSRSLRVAGRAAVPSWDRGAIARSPRRRMDLAEPCSPDSTITGYGQRGSASTANAQATIEYEIVAADIEEEPQGLDGARPPPGSAAAACRPPGESRTGGFSTTRHPISSISTARQASSARSMYERAGVPRHPGCGHPAAVRRNAPVTSRTFSAELPARVEAVRVRGTTG